MNKEQLSEAVGGVSEALLDEAMRFEGMRVRHRWSRRAVIAACAAAALIVSAAAVELANGWRVRVIPVNEYEANLPEDSSAENLLIGDLEVGAYPLSEEVQERIREKGYGFYESEEYASVAELEEAYGIRLLRMTSGRFCEDRYVRARAGEFDPVVRPKGGIMIGGDWVTQNEGWAVETNFQLCTTDVTADELVGGMIHLVGNVGRIVEHEIQSLGVTAQATTVASDGITPFVIVFFIKDNIAYDLMFSVPVQEELLTAENPISDVSMYPTEAELVDWVCEKLETLHY